MVQAIVVRMREKKTQQGHQYTGMRDINPYSSSSGFEYTRKMTNNCAQQLKVHTGRTRMLSCAQIERLRTFHHINRQAESLPSTLLLTLANKS